MSTFLERNRLLVRVVLVLYLLTTGWLLYWFTSFEVQYETRCDAGVMRVLIDSGYAPTEAKSVACTIVDVHGQPIGYTTLLSTVVAAGSALIGFVNNSKPEIPGKGAGPI